MTDGPVSPDLDDIRRGLIWRWIPDWCVPFIILARLERPIGWWLLVLPGWQAIILGGFGAGASLKTVLWLMALFWLGAVVMRGAGCVVNDSWDRDIDGDVERTRNRPLASGAVSLRAAMVFLFLLGVIGLLVLINLPMAAIITGFASLPLIVIYPLAKRVIGFPQVVLSLTFSWGALLGWAAHGQWPGIPAGILYLATAFWVFAYDTIYAIQDMEDDRQVGIRSSALTLGRGLRPVVAGCQIMMVVLLILLGMMMALPAIWYGGVALVAFHLIWQMSRVDVEAPHRAGAIFRSNRDTGLILTVTALIIFVLSA